MDYEKDRLERLNEIIVGLKSGKLKAEDCTEEIEKLAGPRFGSLSALVGADNLHDRYDAGEISAADALAAAQGYADDYPTVPILFLYCSFYAHELEDTLESLGYLALYRLKSAQIEEFSDFGRQPEWEDMMQPLFARLGKDEELLTVWPYLEEGCDHLVNHFLVQEITAGILDPGRDWIDVILDRFKELEPLLVSMLEDQLRLADITACDAPAGLHTLIALVGCLKSPEALPVLAHALTMCVGDPLNEALLALAKLGSVYAEDVSGELREIAGGEEYGEIRMAAVDALGLLHDASGNQDFLRGMLAAWRLGDMDDDHIFRFLAHALLATREEAAVQAVASALERYRRELDDDTVFFTEDYLEHYRDMQLGPRLADILPEGPEDFLRWPPSDLYRERRCTLTLQREDALAAEEEERDYYYDLDTVEMFMHKGRNEPCVCGSGLKFKKCCLPHYEELRERLRRGEEVQAERTPYAALIRDLERFATLPSIRAERGNAIEDFLHTEERTWFEKEEADIGISEESFFDDWFLLARPLRRSGKTVAQEMLEANGDALEPPAATLLRGLAASRFSLCEVWETVPGSEILLRDLFRGEDMRVRERTASKHVVKWDLLATRVGEVGDHYELMGVSFFVPRKLLGAVETFVSRTSEEMIKSKTVEDLEDFLQRKGHLVFHQVMRLVKSEPRPVTITAEGDEFTLCTAVFDIAEGAEARRLLSSHPFIEDEGMEAGARRFIWHMSRGMEDELRGGEHTGPQDKARTFSASPKGMTKEEIEGEIKRGNVMRSLGFLALKGNRLTFETQSHQRLEAGKRELMSVLAGIAKHRADSIQDQEALLGEAGRNRAGMEGSRRGAVQPAAPAAGNDIPPEVLEKAFGELTQRAYGNWLDEPIPYLEGKTPRQAAKTAKGRKLINRLLQEYENQAEREKRAGRTTYDFSRFRRELDIWPE